MRKDSFYKSMNMGYKQYIDSAEKVCYYVSNKGATDRRLAYM